MKLRIHLSPHACERLAKDSSSPLYSWDFGLSLEQGRKGMSDLTEENAPAKGPVVAEVKVTDLPAIKILRSEAEATLRKRLQEVRAQAEVEIRELEDRLNNLLALDYSPTLEPTEVGNGL